MVGVVIRSRAGVSLQNPWRPIAVAGQHAQVDVARLLTAGVDAFRPIVTLSTRGQLNLLRFKFAPVGAIWKGDKPLTSHRIRNVIRKKPFLFVETRQHP